VIGPAAAIVANFQVTETLKILTGDFDHVRRKLLNIDLWTNEIDQLSVAEADNEGHCPCCRDRQFAYLEGKAGSSAATLCGRNAVQLRHRQQAGSINLAAIAERLSRHGEIVASEFMLRAFITEHDEDYEFTLFPDGRAIVTGTDDPGVARSIYAKFVGA
jgi:adenylyltransferase/sulfurtransferase